MGESEHAAKIAEDESSKAKEEADVSAENARKSQIAAENSAKTAKIAHAEADKTAEESTAKKRQADKAHKDAETAHTEQEKVEKEVQAVVDEIETQQNKRTKKIAKLKRITEDPAKGTVAKGKAFQEMKALEGEDPLPLRKAKLEQ